MIVKSVVHGNIQYVLAGIVVVIIITLDFNFQNLLPAQSHTQKGGAQDCFD